MNVVFEIVDWREFYSLNGDDNPTGFRQAPVVMSDFKIELNMVLSPFCQSYEYLVIGLDQVYNVVKIIPYCDNAKAVFKYQYTNGK